MFQLFQSFGEFARQISVGQPVALEFSAGGPRKPIDRNEIRLTRDYSHKVREGHWYGFRFQMGGEFERCGSERWVIGQWKGKQSGKSPWLSQRFDNVVFYVTVDSDGCRCRIAKASGDPDAGAVPEALLAPELRYVDGVIGRCIWTNKTDNPHPDDPRGCRFDAEVERLEGNALPSPYGRWVEMSYYVRAGKNGFFSKPGLIEVYVGTRLVARVTGLIGHDGEMGQRMKFKVGNYRDRQSGAAWILADDVRIAKAPPGVLPW